MSANQEITDPVDVLRRKRDDGNFAPLAELILTAGLPLQQQINIACVDLIALIRARKKAKAEDYIATFPDLLEDEGLLLDLIDAEICARREIGEHPEQSEYVERFRKLAPSIRKLFKFDLIHNVQCQVGGYKIESVVGRGAMGIVYKARQLSLDRDVAVKVIQGKWVGNAVVLTRFFREAYAAAQLRHHNVVQIYDFGEDNGQYFFSMEWVTGGTIADKLRTSEVFESRDAASCILQAARGLLYAHRHGMVHRDVKPANLLISEEGIVKIADLGLVKIPEVQESSPGQSSAVGELLSGSSHVTGFGSAVGTPSYMAPEQAIDAASVDHRADIYSLGYTMYHMLAGHLPAIGIGDLEVFPPALREVYLRSTARNPEERYEDLEPMIEDLERYLEIEFVGAYMPSSDEVNAISECADSWESVSGSRYDLLFLTLFVIACVAVSVGFGSLNLRMAVLPITLCASAILGFFVAADWFDQSSLARSVRLWICEVDGRQMLKLLICVAIVFGAAIVSKTFWHAVAGEFVGLTMGAAFGYWVCSSRHSRRDQPIRKAETLLRTIRRRGIDEQRVRAFVASFAGRNWLGLFERLFGYEAALNMRRNLAGDSASLPLSLRDRMMASMNDATREARIEKDHKTLASIESQGLQASGMSRHEADANAWQVAAMLMQVSRQLEQSEAGSKQASQAKRERIKAMLSHAQSGKHIEEPKQFEFLHDLFGQLSRLIIAMSLLVFVCVLGSNYGFALDGSGLVSCLTDFSFQNVSLLGISTTPALLAIAGLLMFVSSLIQGSRVSYFVIPSAFLIVLAACFGIPSVGPVEGQWLAVGVGGVGFLLGLFFGRVSEDANQF